MPCKFITHGNIILYCTCKQSSLLIGLYGTSNRSPKKTVRFASMLRKELKCKLEISEIVEIVNSCLFKSTLLPVFDFHDQYTLINIQNI